MARARLAAFFGATEARGIALEVVLTDEGDWTCESGPRAMQRILARGERPTALFAANDRIIQAAHQAGLRVSGDLSVVGLDDIEGRQTARAGANRPPARIRAVTIYSPGEID